MAELPASWNLTTRKRNDGKLDIIGKDDSGHEYRARITDTSQVTDKDISELKAADRESYSNPNTRTYDYIKHLTSNPAKAESEAKFEDDLTELAGPVVYAGLGRKGSHVGGGFHGEAAINYENWIKSLREED